jgi:alcohol dehydrogenase class IV
VSQAVAAFRYEAGAQVVRFGWGVASSGLTEEIGALAARRIFAVCGSSGRALVERLAADLPVVAIMDEIRAHVPVTLAQQARSRVHTAGADLVLSVGGGSATGLAKAVALSSGLPIVAVPTTYSGSEATPVWGLTDPPRKTTGTDLRVLPRAVVYDPELTLGLPRDVSVTSGLNALAHCVDAMWAARANPVSTALAVEGIRAMVAGLPAVRDDGADRGGREQCLLGAYLSGAAFAGAGSGLHHKICHILGGAYDLPHAATHSVLLPYVLAFNAPAAPAALARLAQAFGAGDPVAALTGLVMRLGAPTALRELGMPEDGVGTVVEQVVSAVPSGNPRPVTPDAIRGLLTDAWAGETPRQEVVR